MSSLESRLRQDRLSSAPACFVVGQDRDGRWIARSPNGGCGGYFVNRAAALRFAAFESAHRAGAVSVTSDPIDLSF